VSLDVITNAPTETSANAPTDAIGARAAPPQRWKFWGTTLWAVAIAATFVVVGAVWMFGLAMWSGPQPDISIDDFRLLLRSHLALEIAGFVVAALCAFAVLALAIRLTGVGMREYLGLVAVRSRDIKLGLAGLIAIYLAFWVVFYLTGSSPSHYVVDLYRGAQTSGVLWLVLLAVVVAAPFVEEVLIRGFLYRGWAASRLGPIGAVVLTSAVWTILHTQYDWLVLSQIFCIGLLLGAIRRRGGSTTSTMILHAIQNSWSFVFFVLLDKLGLIGA
jgi:membrane protease YdiL (CAAX protease family)